jgi:hypothetical protein
MQREVFSDVQIHSIDFRQVAPSRQPVILRVRLDLPKPFDLLSEMSNSLQSPFEFLVVSDH